MATVQNGIISYDDYLQFIYQCHNTAAQYFNSYYPTNYANGNGPNNSTPSSNGLRDKITKLKKIIAGPFTFDGRSGGLKYIQISTPSLPYTVNESTGTLAATGGTYDKSKITVRIIVVSGGTNVTTI